MIPTATGATTNGSSTPIRQIVAPRSAVSSRPARARDMRIWGTEESRKMLIVLTADFRKYGFSMTSR
jgi:hypothetical protein